MTWVMTTTRVSETTMRRVEATGEDFTMIKYDLVMTEGAGVDDHDENRLIEKGFLEGSASVETMI